MDKKQQVFGETQKPVVRADPGPLWIHPKAQRLPTTHTRSMVVLKGGVLLTVDGGQACFSSDEGLTWSRRPIFGDSASEARWEYTLLQCASGTLVLVYMDASTKAWGWDNEKHEPHPGARMEVWSTRSLDQGQTWSAPVRLFDGYCGAIINSIQTRAGRIIVPVQRLLYDPGRHGQVTYHSDDEGVTWGHSNLLDLGGHGHHDGGFEGCVTELSDGRLWMLIRTNLDRFWQAFSTDGGVYWRTLLPTDIDASSSPGYVARLASGRLVMAWNRLYPGGLTIEQQAQWERAGGDRNVCEPVSSWHRRELSIAFSVDDGAHWTEPTALMHWQRNSLGYPFILERQPGLIWVMTRFNDHFAVSLRETDFIQASAPGRSPVSPTAER